MNDDLDSIAGILFNAALGACLWGLVLLPLLLWGLS